MSVHPPSLPTPDPNVAYPLLRGTLSLFLFLLCVYTQLTCSEQVVVNSPFATVFTASARRLEVDAVHDG